MSDDSSDAERSNDGGRQPTVRPVVGEDEVAALMCWEGRRTVNELNRGLSDVDTKASKLLRTNLVFVGLLLSALSFASDSQTIDVAPFLNSFSAAGTLALVGSTVAAGVTYTSTETRVGISPAAIRQFGHTDVDPGDVEWGVARAYARWIEINRRANVRNGFAATVTILLALGAVVLLTTGAFVGAYDAFFAGWVRPITWLLVVGILAGIGCLADVYRDFRRWRLYERGRGTEGRSVAADPERTPAEAPGSGSSDQKYNRDSEG